MNQKRLEIAAQLLAPLMQSMFDTATDPSGTEEANDEEVAMMMGFAHATANALMKLEREQFKLDQQAEIAATYVKAGQPVPASLVTPATKSTTP